MKIFLLKITLLLCLFSTLGFRPAVVNDNHAVILGSWEYSVLNQGFHFQEGVVVFSLEEGQLKGNVTIGEKVIPMRNLIFEKDRVRAYIFVKGVQVDLYLKFDQDYSFEGTVSNPSGYIKVMGCKKD